MLQKLIPMISLLFFFLTSEAGVDDTISSFLINTVSNLYITRCPNSELPSRSIVSRWITCMNGIACTPPTLSNLSSLSIIFSRIVHRRIYTFSDISCSWATDESALLSPVS